MPLLCKMGLLGFGGQFTVLALDTEAQRDEVTWPQFHGDKPLSQSGTWIGLATKPEFLPPHLEMNEGRRMCAGVLCQVPQWCQHPPPPTRCVSCSIHSTCLVKISTVSSLLREESSHPGPGVSRQPYSPLFSVRVWQSRLPAPHCPQPVSQSYFPTFAHEAPPPWVAISCPPAHKLPDSFRETGHFFFFPFLFFSFFPFWGGHLSLRFCKDSH